MKTLLVIALALALRGVSPALGAVDITLQADALVVASYGLTNLQVLALKDYAALGFASTNEANLATLGTPIQVYRLALAPLQAYTTNIPYNGLLEFNATTQQANRLIVPVVAGGQPKSSISLRLHNGTNWVVEKIGSPVLIQSLAAATDHVPAAYRNGPLPVFAVEFPLFDLWWISYYDATNDLRLIASRNMPLGAPNVAAFAEMPPLGMYKIATTAQRYNQRPN
jgi:hypothetical protein